MDNTAKLLRAFINAQGFDVETVEDVSRFYKADDIMSNGEPKEHACPSNIIRNTNYKVTKSEFNSKPTLHKIVREYERGIYTASEMICRIMLLEGVNDEDL